MFHHNHDDTDFCDTCAEWPVWARYLSTQLTEMRTAMSADQDHLDQTVTRLEAAVTALNGAIVPPAPLNFAAADTLVAQAEADVAALPVVPPVA